MEQETPSDISGPAKDLFHVASAVTVLGCCSSNFQPVIMHSFH